MGIIKGNIEYIVKYYYYTANKDYTQRKSVRERERNSLLWITAFTHREKCRFLNEKVQIGSKIKLNLFIYLGKLG